MLSAACKSAAIAGTFVALAASVSTVAFAQDAVRILADNDGVFIDGKALTVTAGQSKGDVASHIGNLNVRPLGPGAIVFRSGDKLYMVEGGPMGAAQTMYDPPIDRQRSYGGLSDPYPGADRQRSYGGLSDPYPGADRQRSYGGLYDPYPNSDYRNDRQRSYGGLYDPYPGADRQRSYGGFYDTGAESRRQQSYGGLYDPYPSADRQRSYGGFYDSGAKWRRQQSYGGLHDPDAEWRRQQSYGIFHDPDYANYRLKKAFSEVWGATDKN